MIARGLPEFLVGLVATTLVALPEFAARLNWFLEHRPDLAALVSKWHVPGRGDRRLLSLVPGERIKPILAKLLDETEFLSDYGIRALSRVHCARPYRFEIGPDELTVRYQPAESDSGLFGGNSNWRGPIWFPVNYLLIESLQKFHHYYGNDFKVECPTGSGNYLTLEQVSEELGRRLSSLFLRGPDGRRPLYGSNERLQTDPHFRDYLVFPEYFDGDTGRGVGASHQTGWTGLVAKLLMPRRRDVVSSVDREPATGPGDTRSPEVTTARARARSGITSLGDDL